MSRIAHYLSLFGFLALSGCSSDETTTAKTGVQTGDSGTGTGGSAAGTELNWFPIVIAAILLAGAVGVFFVVRSQRRPRE